MTSSWPRSPAATGTRSHCCLKTRKNIFGSDYLIKDALRCYEESDFSLTDEESDRLTRAVQSCLLTQTANCPCYLSRAFKRAISLANLLQLKP